MKILSRKFETVQKDGMTKHFFMYFILLQRLSIYFRVKKVVNKVHFVDVVEHRVTKSLIKILLIPFIIFSTLFFPTD